MNAIATASRMLGDKKQTITMTMNGIDADTIANMYGDIQLFQLIKPASVTGTVPFDLDTLTALPSNDDSASIQLNQYLTAIVSLTIEDAATQTYKSMNFAAPISTGTSLMDPISDTSVKNDINTAFQKMQTVAPPARLSIDDNKVFVDNITVKYI